MFLWLIHSLNALLQLFYSSRTCRDSKMFIKCSKKALCFKPEQVSVFSWPAGSGFHLFISLMVILNSPPRRSHSELLAALKAAFRDLSKAWQLKVRRKRSQVMEIYYIPLYFCDLVRDVKKFVAQRRSTL